MIIDLPPHIEQAIIAKAHEQGLTVQEMLTKDYDDIWQVLDQHGLNGDEIRLTDDETRHLMNLLDNPPAQRQEPCCLGIAMFEPLDKHHNRTAFDCGQDDINRYLQIMASQHHKKGVQGFMYWQMTALSRRFTSYPTPILTTPP